MDKMILLAFAIFRIFGYLLALPAGFVVLGAVAPEPAKPTMIELSGGDTALATIVFVIVGLGTLAIVPGAILLLLGMSVGVAPALIIEQFMLALTLPMTLAVATCY